MKRPDRQLAKDKKVAAGIFLLMLLLPLSLAGFLWAGHKIFGSPWGWMFGLAAFAVIGSIASLIDTIIAKGKENAIDE